MTRKGAGEKTLICLLQKSIFFLSAIAFTFAFFPPECRSEEPVRIEADSIEYDTVQAAYFAKGNVRVWKGTLTVTADKAEYHEKTADLLAEGSISYDEPDITITARQASLNLKGKTGTLLDAEVFSKKDNFHIKGARIEKKGEKEYALADAILTTCDGLPPDWCLKGKDVDIVIEDRVRAKGVTFAVRDLPILYSPYFTASINRERKSGFLNPGVGYVEDKGFHFEQPLYWAISDTMDATFLADYYTERGFGEGLEYRFVAPDRQTGKFWFYHIYDTELGQHFWDVRGVYDRERDRPVTGYLNVNYINDRIFHDEYNQYTINQTSKFLDPTTYLTVTSGRYLASTGEVMYRSDLSRVFLDFQHLIDLKAGVDSSTIPQKLPEAGYFLRPRMIGPLLFSLSSGLSYFWREQDPSGIRLDLYPRFTHSFGDPVTFTQTLGLRETAYALSSSERYKDKPHREGLDYTATAHTRLMKQYPSFMHTLEPSLSYTYVPPIYSNLPLFDLVEFYGKTSVAELALLNRFRDAKGEFLTLRVTQPYDLNGGDRPFLPLKVEVAAYRFLNLRGEASYDVHSGKLNTVTSDISIGLFEKGTATLGERYNRPEDILYFSAGINYAFTKSFSAEGNFWYDAKVGDLRDVIAKVKYQKQCWGATVVFAKRQEDYSVTVLVDLLGLGTVRAPDVEVYKSAP